MLPFAGPCICSFLVLKFYLKKIRTNICVKGIIAQENEVKISQYDHGTTVILDGSKESFYISLYRIWTISALYMASGLTTKTMARWIDTYTNRGEKLCPKGDLKWGQKQSESHRLSTNPEETVEA